MTANEHNARRFESLGFWGLASAARRGSYGEHAGWVMRTWGGFAARVGGAS